MPPKVKFTKEQIADAAFQIVRKNGISSLSARFLARTLGCSPQPMFSYFENMEELQTEVIKSAKSLYSEYVNQGLKDPLPFKGVGMQYIQFAKDEPELFALLFMSETDTCDVTHFLPSGDDNSPAILAALQSFWKLPKGQAMNIYNHLSVYTHGLAVLFAKRSCVFTMNDVGSMLSEVFMALLRFEQNSET